MLKQGIMPTINKEVNISISMIPKVFISAFRNDLAPVKILYAITSPPFSAAMNSACQHTFSLHLNSVPALALILNPKV